MLILVEVHVQNQDLNDVQLTSLSFFVIQDGVQDGRQCVMRPQNLRKQVNVK